jgi:hypothetical protein
MIDETSVTRRWSFDGRAQRGPAAAGEASGFMHTSLRVTGVLSGVESSVVLGLGFRGWAAPEPVRDPVLVVLMRVIVSRAWVRMR